MEASPHIQVRRNTLASRHLNSIVRGVALWKVCFSFAQSTRGESWIAHQTRHRTEYRPRKPRRKRRDFPVARDRIVFHRPRSIPLASLPGMLSSTMVWVFYVHRTNRPTRTVFVRHCIPNTTMYLVIRMIHPVRITLVCGCRSPRLSPRPANISKGIA